MTGISPEEFTGLSIVLGVSGGIAAYKAADLTSKLVQRGAAVDVVMTAGAQSFIQPLTFNALTRRPVYSAIDTPWTTELAGHVTLAAETHLVVIAPATANIIARLAHGNVDDMLTAIVLATNAPVMIAPAMEHNMWHHPASRHNLEILRQRGVIVVEPESGRLASGASGDGRLAAIETILQHIRSIVGTGPLSGRRFVISAGGTKEAIDPVRYIGNRSSGLMGVELALAASARGADVTLVAVEDVPVPPGRFQVIRVRSARDMESVVGDATVGADVLIMAAAVADFRPIAEARQKLKKQAGQDAMVIELTRNPDILAGIDRPGLLKIGFAAETEHLHAHAEAKLRTKGLAMIVANDAVATIGSEQSEATLLFPDRDPVTIPRSSKRIVAGRIVDEVQRLLESAGA